MPADHPYDLPQPQPVAVDGQMGVALIQRYALVVQIPQRLARLDGHAPGMQVAQALLDLLVAQL